MNEQIVNSYLDLFFSSKVNLVAIRELLADSFTFSGPLLNAHSADEYITKLQGVGGLKMDNAKIISNAEQVAVLYDMITPYGKVRTVEWFTVKNNKIHAIELLNDPRLLLEAFSE